MKAGFILLLMAVLMYCATVGAEMADKGGDLAQSLLMNPTYEPSTEISGDNITSEKKIENFSSILLDFSGKWDLILIDEEIRNVNLTVYQVEENVFGSGNVMLYNKTQNITAAGEANGNILNLYLVTLEGDMMYKLNIYDSQLFSGSYQLFSGSYEVYFADGTRISGNLDYADWIPLNPIWPPAGQRHHISG